MVTRASTVVAGVKRDLAALGPEVECSALAASALALARELDKAKTPAAAKAACARGLRETLDRLREMAPQGEKRDRIDELGARRRGRRASA